MLLVPLGSAQNARSAASATAAAIDLLEFLVRDRQRAQMWVRLGEGLADGPPRAQEGHARAGVGGEQADELPARVPGRAQHRDAQRSVVFACPMTHKYANSGYR